ncbi:class I SAM-dependent DNA methyltransferase [Marivita hallyeonensis]|uniref:Methyltransferase domain-containing protein n=1 Tax=Marivita hallyeonensis TaxID=996342 RepID=A0A1M5VPA7_9RHOB|nr:class I SAM-dependent methyltransferase [Marivita hallyeonensis]SHH76753.1 Methyltransferase domain-containing protein [Marivita hallyeonensis]
MPDFDLEKAYAIDGAEDAKAFYDTWAAAYDSGFSDRHGYVAPREIARVFKSLSDGNDPILDIGAGTGLVAEHLTGCVVDGIDISEGMLAEATAKGVYRTCIQADLTKTLPVDDASYGGFVSCGTFTHGHVGADVLPELIRIARPGALFTCGVIPSVYDGAGFGSRLALLVATDAITPVDFREFAIYENATHDHADDRGLAMIFRRL